MRLIPFIILPLSFTTLISCVEVKDKNQAGPATYEVSDVQEIQKVLHPDLLVDQPLYLYKGGVLSEDQFLRVKNHSNTNEDQLSYDFNQVVFKNGGTLYTMGALVVINAQSIVSDMGKLATMPLNQVASQGKDGRSGGNIVIRAFSAEGPLEVTLRGENGGQGLEGAPPTEELRGKNGVDSVNPYCDSPPGPEYMGSPGSRGKQGYQGGIGFKGGHSGFLEINVENEKNFSLESILSAVKGESVVLGAGEAMVEKPVATPVSIQECLIYLWPRADQGELGLQGLLGEEGGRSLCQKQGLKMQCL